MVDFKIKHSSPFFWVGSLGEGVAKSWKEPKEQDGARRSFRRSRNELDGVEFDNLSSQIELDGVGRSWMAWKCGISQNPTQKNRDSQS